MPQKTFIALLRGINVTGHNSIAMAELRSLCASLGWDGVQSYIQSGNLVFRASASQASLETELERAIERQLGLTIPVIVRHTAQWSAYIQGNPFPEASLQEPNRVLLALSKLPPKADAAAELQKRAPSGERVLRVGDALWIHYAAGIGTSKLTPALLDRLAGSPVTARNWNTVLKLAEMASQSKTTDE